MTRKRRTILSAIAGGLVTLAALPAAASATTTVQPGSLTFPERQVATTSDPQTLTVVVQCTVVVMGNCTVNDLFQYNPQFGGANPGDFSATNLTCPPALPNNNLSPGVCQFTVRFTPIAPGTRTAVLTAGTASTSNPNTVAVSGTAVAAPVVPVTPTPTTPAKKKCKKGKKGKKCRKKQNK
jgi:hypothetical protein